MFDKLNHYLLFHDWNVICGKNVNDSYEYLVNTENKYLEEISPLKLCLIAASEHFLELWMNVKLCKLNRKCKKKLFQKSKVLVLSTAAHNSYLNYRRMLNRLKVYEKRTFYRNLFVKIGKDSKSM